MTEHTSLDYAVLLGIGVLWGPSFVFSEWAQTGFRGALVCPRFGQGHA